MDGNPLLLFPMLAFAVAIVIVIVIDGNGELYSPQAHGGGERIERRYPMCLSSHVARDDTPDVPLGRKKVHRVCFTDSRQNEHAES